MFLLYAIVAGVIAGLALGGRIEGLAGIRFRWAPLAIAGLAVQVALFTPPIGDRIGDLGAPLYIASSAAVLAMVLRNLAIPGLALVALGAASNLVAIVANGGWMPASPDALAALGATIGSGYSNSRETAAPALAALTDIMALPAWLPGANVFSIGDLLIGTGVFAAVVVGMRRRRPPEHDPNGTSVSVLKSH